MHQLMTLTDSEIVDPSYRYPFTPYPKSWYFVKEARGPRSLKLCGKTSFENEKSLPIHTYQGMQFLHWGGDPVFDLDQVPRLPEFHDPEWLKPFKLTFHARTHVQEVAENAVDLAHFSRVHDYYGEPEMLSFKVEGTKFTICMRARRKILGVLDEPSMEITYYGFGLVIAKVWSKNVELRVLLTNTPVDPQHIIINHWIAIRKKNWMRNVINRSLIPSVIYKEFYNDLPIWKDKIYHPNPCLVASENNILLVRKWSKQFYQ